jgi:UDP-3-O-[3-hydroxymyristoyl] glucosamine N-acyltransferase
MKIHHSVTAHDVLKAGGPLITETLGSLDVTLNHFATPQTAHSQSVGFLNSPKYLKDVENSSMVCVLAPLKMKADIEKLNSKKTWLFSPNVELAAREVKKALFFSTPFRAHFEGIHPTAVVHPSVEMAADVTLGPYVIINENVKIGEGTFIGAHTVVEQNTVIKSHVTLHPFVYIGHSTVLGHRCEIKPQAVIGSEGYGYAHDQQGNHFRIPHTGRVILEDDVHVGAGTAIDRGTIEDTVIGQGTKIDNQVHLAHNTEIGKNGLITAQVVTAGSTSIGDNFICGGKTAITGHIKITDNVNVAGFSGVANNVTEPGAYGGYPLLPLKNI